MSGVTALPPLPRPKVEKERSIFDAHDVFSKLVRVAGRFLDANLHYLGRLPRDENLHRAVMAQRPYVDLYPQSPASRAMTQVAHRLLEQAPPDQLDGGMKLLWQRLFRESGAQPA